MSIIPLRAARLLELLHGPRGSLRRRLIGGTAWHLGVTVYNSTLLLTQTLLATQLIADPREFGLVNSVMWAYTLAEVFTSSGLTLAITQHRGDLGPLLPAVWTAQAVRGVVLGAAITGIGAAMSAYYGEPRIARLALIAAMSAPLNGLAGLGPVLALRDLRFKRAALFSAFETTLGAAVSCALIASLRSAEAVAFGLTSMALARIVTSYCMLPSRPRIDFRWRVLKPFAGFAVSVFLASILAFLNERGDDFVVGSLLGLPALGLYHVAYLYANLPGLKLGQVLGNLLIPLFSRLREDPPRFRAAFLKFLALSMTASTLVFVPLFILAPGLFRLVAAGRFLPAVPVFRVLCLFGALRFFQFSSEAAFHALGRPQVVTRSHFIQFVVLGLLVVPLTIHWGLLGAGIAVAAAISSSSIFGVWNLQRLLAREEPPPAVTLPAPRTSEPLEVSCVR
jgi:PST family polysaccharide transporter/lipopolysaccharide exporter